MILLRCYPDPFGFGFLFEAVSSGKNIRISIGIAGDVLSKIIPYSLLVTVTFGDDITLDTTAGGMTVTAESPLYYILYAFKVACK